MRNVLIGTALGGVVAVVAWRFAAKRGSSAPSAGAKSSGTTTAYRAHAPA